jgi:hypothetical protein
MAIAAVALGAVVAWYAVGPLLSSPVHVVQQGCPFLDTPAQSGNGLRVRELWNRIYKPPGTPPYLPRPQPPAGAVLSNGEHFHRHNTSGFVRA